MAVAHRGGSTIEARMCKCAIVHERFFTYQSDRSCNLALSVHERILHIQQRVQFTDKYQQIHRKSFKKEYQEDSSIPALELILALFFKDKHNIKFYFI
jgi:hypothetical protein